MWNFKLPKEIWFVFKWVMLLLIISNILWGCASKTYTKNGNVYENYPQFLKNITTSPSKKKKEPEILPIFKKISPLEKRVTVAFYQEYYENVLFFLAHEAGLNLLIDPAVRKEIPPEKEKITLQLKDQPLKDLLNKVCEILDIYCHLEKDVLKVEPFEEKIFHLGFIPVVEEGRTSMGGDVLGNIEQGGAGTEIISPLRGEFSIQAELTKKSLDIYTSLEKTLSTLLSKEGKYNLNRLTGILYVKDRPSHIKTIENVIKEFKNKYKKQIILDAKIIEVQLNRAHNLGVDWFEITNYLMGQNEITFNTLHLGITTRTGQHSFALTISGKPNVNLILNLLKEYGRLKVVSNPRITVLHSQAALISVGTSQSYIKEFEKEVTSGTNISTITYTTETSSVFDGILLGITPYVAGDNEIFLHIVPIKSEVVELKDVHFGENYFITLPKVNLREMTSIVKAKPGDLLVIGGLILNRHKNSEKRIVLPLVSRFFKNSVGETQKVELVILIKILMD